MKKLQTTALLTAIGAFAVAVQAEPAWNYTFDTAADDNMLALTNTYWHADSIDASSEVVALAGSEYEEGAPDTVSGNVLKLATDAADFTFSPEGGVDGSGADEVLVDADVYFVGSDSAPAIEAGTVQAALYLAVPEDPDDPEAEAPTLKLYASDPATQLDGWISLNAEIADKSWHHVQVRINYNANIPLVRVLIDGVEATQTGENTPQLASYSIAKWGETKTLNSVAFRGTGAVDNFVGETYVSARYNFVEEIYVDGALSEAYTNESVAAGTVAASSSGNFPAFAKFVNEKAIDHVDVYDFTSGGYTTYTGFVYDGDIVTELPAGFPGEIGEEDPFGDTPISFSVSTDAAEGAADGSSFVMVKVFYGAAEPPPVEEDFPAEWNVPADAPAAVTDAFKTWKAAQGDADLSTEAAAKAFLLGVNVGDELPDLEITSISIVNGKVVVEGDVANCNGVVYLRAADTLAGLPSGEAVSLDADVSDEATAKFFKICVGFAMPASDPE